jgi:hypothetical protein
MSKRIFASEQIFASHYLIVANTSFKIFILKRIFATIQANIRLQIFANKQIFTSKYSREGGPLQRGGGGRNGTERGVVSPAVPSHSTSHG